MYQLNTVYPLQFVNTTCWLYLTLFLLPLPSAVGNSCPQLAAWAPLYGISFLARANCTWGDFWAELGLFLFFLKPGRHDNNGSHHYLQIWFKWASSFGIAGGALWFSVHDITESLNMRVCHLNSHRDAIRVGQKSRGALILALGGTSNHGMTGCMRSQPCMCHWPWAQTTRPPETHP